jgi:hypothetical protein
VFTSANTTAADTFEIERMTFEEIVDLFGQEYLDRINTYFQNTDFENITGINVQMRTPHRNPYLGGACTSNRIIEFGPYGVVSGADICREHANCILSWREQYWSVVCGGCGFHFRFRCESTTAHILNLRGGQHEK